MRVEVICRDYNGAIIFAITKVIQIPLSPLHVRNQCDIGRDSSSIRLNLQRVILKSDSLIAINMISGEIKDNSKDETRLEDIQTLSSFDEVCFVHVSYHTIQLLKLFLLITCMLWISQSSHMLLHQTKKKLIHVQFKSHDKKKTQFFIILISNIKMEI